MTGEREASHIAERFEKMLIPVLAKGDYSLIKTEYVKESGVWYLRAYIRRNDDEALGINDCAYVSRIMSKQLDKADYIEDSYTMEICSGGFMEAAQTEPDPDIPDDDLG